MSEDKDKPDSTSADAAPVDGPAPGWKEEDVPTEVSEDSVTLLGDAITQASQGWLRDRFGLVEDAEGGLHIPAPGRWPDLGQRADQFVRGFFRGFVEKSPEEREAAYGIRDAADVPAGSELVGRLLARFSNTVTDTWRSYIAEHAPEEGEQGERVVDGTFVVQHGASLLGTMISELGKAFEDVGLPGGTSIHEGHYDPPSEPSDGADGELAEAEGVEARSDAGAVEDAGAPAVDGPKIRYDVDLGSIFRALFSPRN